MFGIYENGSVIAKFAAPMSVRSNKPILVSDALSLKRFSSSGTAQRWEIETNVEPLTFGAHTLMVHLVTKGHTESTQVLMPQNYGVLATMRISGTPTADGVAGASSVSITSHSGFIPAGTFVSFGNHSKVYMTTASLTSNGSLNLYPQLRVTVPPGTVMKRGKDVIGNFYYDSDSVVGMMFSDGIMMDMGSVKLVEAL